jgi:hypothetical protein
MARRKHFYFETDLEHLSKNTRDIKSFSPIVIDCEQEQHVPKNTTYPISHFLLSDFGTSVKYSFLKHNLGKGYGNFALLFGKQKVWKA